MRSSGADESRHLAIHAKGWGKGVTFPRGTDSSVFRGSCGEKGDLRLAEWPKCSASAAKRPVHCPTLPHTVNSKNTQQRAGRVVT